ncbi:hypothetical protein COLO4_17957 [Corchorus olitorius]|uniref:Uncharacterized protein n=1 Tax=Corchorus olitorius TaxID=93759 RepID=A0A1R3JB09_9ROSI|nr:hypothetical protein COLO4_17957 [Corchorus olitorius]
MASYHARSNSLPSRQHPISSQIDETLNRLSTAKDALLQTKESTQELQSILRRRRGVEGLASEVRKYLTSRKSVKKAICKALKNLKHMENKEGENGDVITILRQVETVTCSVLESLLSFVSGPEAESKMSRWSLVTKLMYQKRVTSEEDESNEIVNAEATLRSFLKSENAKHIEDVQNELQNSELCIQDLEEGIESLYRRLIKARVTVLNIVNC